jgi:hypothetical protein
LEPCNILDGRQNTDIDEIVCGCFIGDVTLRNEEDLSIVVLLTLLNSSYRTLTACEEWKVCPWKVNRIAYRYYWEY